jgi:hypothetical protein
MALFALGDPAASSAYPYVITDLAFLPACGISASLWHFRQSVVYSPVWGILANL